MAFVGKLSAPQLAVSGSNSVEAFSILLIRTLIGLYLPTRMNDNDADDGTFKGEHHKFSMLVVCYFFLFMQYQQLLLSVKPMTLPMRH
jgi:hypothetical protein